MGLFWTAGNPAGLRDELSDRRADYALGIDREKGSLRRPLDPVASSRRQGSGLGWTPTSARLALLGHVVLDQEHFDPGTRADVVEAYPTSPFVTLDTSSTATQRTRIRLEGATAIRLGPWALGTALGYESREHLTSAAGFVRRTRQVLPGATIGITRTLGPVRFGPYARFRKRVESISLTERESQGIAVQLEGLRDVRPLDILGFYGRRIDEDVRSAGWSFGGPLAGGVWAAYAERSWLNERLTRQQSDEPAEDKWAAREWSGGGAYQKAATRGIVTIEVRHSVLAGDGDLALDSAGVIFSASERATSASVEWRVLPDTVAWAFAIGVHMLLESRVRSALTVPIAAKQTGLTNTVSFELGRSLTPKLFAVATLAVAGYSANSSFPSPLAMGDTYRAYILPEYDLLARRARPWLVGAGVRRNTNAWTSIWAQISAEQLSATEDGITSFEPRGFRSAVALGMGVTVSR